MNWSKQKNDLSYTSILILSWREQPSYSIKWNDNDLYADLTIGINPIFLELDSTCKPSIRIKLRNFSEREGFSSPIIRSTHMLQQPSRRRSIFKKTAHRGYATRLSLPRFPDEKQSSQPDAIRDCASSTAVLQSRGTIALSFPHHTHTFVSLLLSPYLLDSSLCLG